MLTIRVLHLINEINRYDQIDNILRHCDRRRFEMSLCTFNGRSPIDPPVYTDVSRYILDLDGRRSYPRGLAKLVSILIRERIDIVHTHLFDPMMLGVTAARVTGRKAIIHRHYSDLLYRIPSPWKRRLYLRTEALCHRFAARVVAPTAMTHDLLTRVQGVDARKVVQIPYGFDLAKYEPSNEGPSRIRHEFAPDGQVLIACIGRLFWEKGQIDLLRAVHALVPKYPRLRVLLVGDGPDREKLEAVARRLGLEHHVSFMGFRRDVVDVLAAVDIVVQPSISECFCQAMVEALALARPLIMSDVSGARDVVKDGHNGLLVAPQDSGAIGRALAILLNTPDYARRLGEQGREDVKQALGIRRIINRFEDCYEAVHEESHAKMTDDHRAGAELIRTRGLPRR